MKGFTETAFIYHEKTINNSWYSLSLYVWLENNQVAGSGLNLDFLTRISLHLNWFSQAYAS